MAESPMAHDPARGPGLCSSLLWLPSQATNDVLQPGFDFPDCHTSTKPHFMPCFCASTRRGASPSSKKFLHWNLTACNVSSLCITLTLPATSHRASRNTSHPPSRVRRRRRTSRKHTQPSPRPSHQPTAPSARSRTLSSPYLPSHSSSYLP
jgi:hypothetical protein